LAFSSDSDHPRAKGGASSRRCRGHPNNPSRARKSPLDKRLHAQRHLIGCCFSKLKQFRRVATRFEKTARNHLAVVTLAATILW
jgi:transposase